MATVNFEKNKKEALKNLISDKTDNRRHINTIINDKSIDTNTNLSLEYITLYGAFVYDVGESFPVVKYDRFRNMFLDLREALELHMETKEYDKKTLKRIMVHLGLELGTDIRFTDELQQMLSENLLEKDYSDLQENFTFETLYEQYKPKEYSNKKRTGLNVEDLYKLYEQKLENDNLKSSVGYPKKLVVGEEYQSDEAPQTRGRKK